MQEKVIKKLKSDLWENFGRYVFETIVHVNDLDEIPELYIVQQSVMHNILFALIEDPDTGINLLDCLVLSHVGRWRSTVFVRPDGRIRR